MNELGLMLQQLPQNKPLLELQLTVAGVISEATLEEGVKVVVAEALCYLKFSREGKLSFVSQSVAVDPDVCNGCGLCVRTFGCPAITLAGGKAVIEPSSCNGCAVCIAVCKRGAIK